MMKKVAKKHKFRIWQVATALLVLVLGYLFFRQIEMRIQKAEFKRAETYVEQSASDISRESSAPYTRLTDRSCYYASQKFSRGPRSCEVVVRLIYRNMSPLKANDLLDRFTHISKAKLYGYGPNNATRYSTREPYQTVSQDVESNVLESCTKKFTFYNVDSVGGVARAGDFVVAVSCYGNALAEYYPVID